MSIILDRFSYITEVFSRFPSFKITETNNAQRKITFKYEDSSLFELWLLDDDYDYNSLVPYISVVNLIDDFPHVLEKVQIAGFSFQFICLYHGELIFSDQSKDDKIAFLLSQLMNLLTLNNKEKELEYQKEFLHYWNSNINDIRMFYSFIGDSFENESLVIYENRKKKNNFRIVPYGVKLNDINGWKKNGTKIIVVEIIDSDGILPNSKTNEWSENTLNDIFKNRYKDKISKENYEHLKSLKVNNSVIFYFIMTTPIGKIHFGCNVKFKDLRDDYLFNQIDENLLRIDNIYIEQQEIDYLSRSIGNDTRLSKKNFAVIGAGSLGSYVVEELVNAGASTLLLIDKDLFVSKNLMRHKLVLGNTMNNKAEKMVENLNRKHPQIDASYRNEMLTASSLLKLVKEDNVDILIFTIGSTDSQLEFEKILSQEDFTTTIIYSFLSPNGENSYVIVNNNSKELMFSKFLRTNSYESDNNEHLIFDGCGGTRVKYGNRTLLMATNSLIYAINHSENTKSSFILKSHVDQGIQMQDCINTDKLRVINVDFQSTKQ